MAEKTPDNFKHIVRIANVDVPGEKQIRFALTTIKGVGINFADAICSAAKVKREAKTGYLADEEIKLLDKILTNPGANGIPVWMFNHKKDPDSGEDKHFIMGTLTFAHDNDLKLLKKIKCYRGLRHIRGLPVRGQRTRSNFRKSKGKVVGVTKKKAAPGTETKGDAKGDKGGKDKGSKDKGKK